MKNNNTLADKVRRRQEDYVRRRDKSVLSKEAVNALRLSQQYSHIKPKPYTIPLDTLAGFNVTGKTLK